MRRISAVLLFVVCVAGIIVNTALHLHDGLNAWLGLGALATFMGAL